MRMHDNPEYQYKFLEAHLRNHDLGHYIDDNVNKLQQLYDEYMEYAKEEGITASREDGMLAALVALTSSKLRRDFFDFFKFTTDSKRIQPIMRHLIDFHLHGPDALPGYIRPHGEFVWRKDHTVELSLLVRGIGKSVYLMARGVWNLAKYPTDKTLVIHGKQDLSSGNISLIKSLIVSPALAIVFPHIFQPSIQDYRAVGSALRRNSLDLELKRSAFDFDDLEHDELGLYKKEATYQAASLKTDETGSHYARVLFDDLVNNITSRSPEATEELIEYVQSLSGLEEYDSKRSFEYEGVGTQWWAENAYDYIRDEMNSSFFSLPIEWTHEGTKYYISPIFNEKKVQEKVRSLGVWAESQLYMIPRPLENDEMNLGFDKDAHVLHFKEAELQALLNTGVRVQVCDPAYSKKGKKEGDGKSRFTILQVLMLGDTMYAYDIYSSKGERNNQTVGLNTDAAIEHNIDVFIMDAQGTQESLFLDVRDSLYINYDATITTIPYRKGSNFRGLTGKADIANGVLGTLVAEGRLKVIVTEENAERVQLIIDQLSGKDPGFDIIDTLVYAKVSVKVKEEEARAIVRRNTRNGIQPARQYTRKARREQRKQQQQLKRGLML